MDSLAKITPPSVAMIGTNSCNTAAMEALRSGNAAYHMAYPIPAIIAPEAIASIMPSSCGLAASAALK